MKSCKNKGEARQSNRQILVTHRSSGAHLTQMACAFAHRPLAALPRQDDTSLTTPC